MGMFYETRNHQPEAIESDPDFHEPILKSAGEDGEFEFDNGSIPNFVDASTPKDTSAPDMVKEYYTDEEYEELLEEAAEVFDSNFFGEF